MCHRLYCAEVFTFADLLEYINQNGGHGKVIVECDHKLFDYNTDLGNIAYNYPFDVVASLGPAEIIKCGVYETGWGMNEWDYYITIPYKYSKLLE